MGVWWGHRMRESLKVTKVPWAWFWFMQRNFLLPMYSMLCNIPPFKLPYALHLILMTCTLDQPTHRTICNLELTLGFSLSNLAGHTSQHVTLQGASIFIFGFGILKVQLCQCRCLATVAIMTVYR